MNLLQRHIFKSVVFACAVAAGIFSFVLIVGNAFKDLLGYLLAGQLTAETFLQLLLLLVPFVSINALPIGMLTGVLLVLGRMSAQQEITAMRSAGLGIGFVARPILLIAALGVIVSLGLNFYYMPLARTLYRSTVNDAVRQNPLSIIVEKTFIRDFPGFVVYVGQKKGGELGDVWLWRLDKEKRVTEFLRAQTGRIAYDDDLNVMKVRLLNTFSDRRNPKNPELFANTDAQVSMDEVAVDIPLDNLFGRQVVQRKLSSLTFGELLERKRQLERDNAPLADRMKVSTTLNEKGASSFTLLAFTLLAIPLGIKVSRKETSANLGIALLLTLGYYFLTVAVGWLDRTPALRPDLLVWLPPVLFIGCGVWLFRRVERI
ncbi:MAG: LptF/LptG family permease [Opitutus sp.]|jgi:lipopolysaccharide export system permease protein|nr:LptF/LptG family permease [Opitutus sp.]MCS6248219.1 LptF/LptG family permease [Opitutus sp.]MCS6274369.1 LptF/LptG family permease [Opitutus sp.]MCS6278469.1 LptF/LptG family permease [Opitutus sp.]MCS6300128.1 LptF/LptG family permease [Opitutus sp.]